MRINKHCTPALLSAALAALASAACSDSSTSADGDGVVDGGDGNDDGPDAGGGGVVGGPAYPGAGDIADVGLPGATMRCFYGPDTALPLATLEYLLEVNRTPEQVHVRLTLDPNFVDNTYGANAIGWEDTKKGGHTFKDLVGSDHAELLLTDANGGLAFDLAIDYLTQRDDGDYASLGVWGGDGEVIEGDPAAVLSAMTSLDRNFNERGYSSFVVDSPATTADYAPSSEAPGWDYRVVYEVWVDAQGFGAAGFGEASLEYVHASPSKSDNTVVVDPDPCPPDWDPNPPTCPGDEECPPDTDPPTCPGDPECPPECEVDADCAPGEVCDSGGACGPKIG